MTHETKINGIKHILASSVLVFALVFSGIVLKDRFFSKPEMTGQMSGNGVYRKLQDTGQGIVVASSYARSNGASAQAGAVFMLIKNYTDEDDRLVSATTEVSNKAMLHTHKMDAKGLMSMIPVKDGLKIPSHTIAALKRGGYHVMLMGLKRALKQGDTFKLSLNFEKTGTVTVTVPVDLKR